MKNLLFVINSKSNHFSFTCSAPFFFLLQAAAAVVADLSLRKLKHRFYLMMRCLTTLFLIRYKLQDDDTWYEEASEHVIITSAYFCKLQLHPVISQIKFPAAAMLLLLPVCNVVVAALKSPRSVIVQ